ncbi:MAG: phosphoglucosamine mutase [Acidobacteriota bacterium]|nr:phosphoglucosamine mutase [Acidobacteriota bacterium]
MGKQLFGTDGIRGVAGEPPLDPRTVYACGLALGADLNLRTTDPEVLIGMDTRESGAGIAAHLAGGLAAEGVRFRFAGVITTPGVAHLTRTVPFAAGVMISASHNPYQDNGIKVFSATGYKLPDDEEHLVEEEIFRTLETGFQPRPASLSAEAALPQRYLEYLLSTAATPLTGMRLVLDCGNGAAFQLAPELFRRAGAEVTVIGGSPDGRNINRDCGALHVDALRQRVLEAGADAGVAFDGDADRAILVSGSGKIIDGDHVLLIAARSLQQAGRLAGNTVVSTVMSNLGLERALDRLGIRMLRTPVGDKYVLEEMIRQGAVLGGEQSGHVIFREFSTTGDGMLTALRVLEIARAANQTLDSLTDDLAIYPQRLVNIPVRERRPLNEMPLLQKAIAESERALDSSGRVLVRFSGTEPLARVMVEGPSLAIVEMHSSRIADVIRAELA